MASPGIQEEFRRRSRRGVVEDLAGAVKFGHPSSPEGTHLRMNEEMTPARPRDTSPCTVVATVGHSHPAQVDPIDVTLEESPPDLTGKETEPPRPPDTPEAAETPTSTDDPGLRTTEGPPPDEEGATATTTAETLPSAPVSRTDIVDVTGEAQEKEEKATESNEISSPPPDGGGNLGLTPKSP